MNVHRFYELFLMSLQANVGWLKRVRLADRPEELTGLAPLGRSRLELSPADKYTLLTMVHIAESIPSAEDSFIDKKQQQYAEGVITDCEFVISLVDRIAEELEGASQRLTGTQR